MDKKKSSDGRIRNFGTMVYPESAPANWFDILSEARVPAFVSPLHDQDINPGGEPKKPHYHVMVLYEGKKSDEQVREFFKSFGGVGLEKVASIRGYARYLCHLDNPEKAQYDQAAVRSLAGADYISTIGLAIDKYKALNEMEDFCERYNIVSFFALSRYASLHRSDWSRILKDNGAIYMREYLQSRKWSLDNNLTSIVDPVTGEVILEGTTYKPLASNKQGDDSATE